MNDNDLASGDMRAQLLTALVDECAPGEEVQVLLDATVEGVVAPEHLRAGGVWFTYSRHFPIPIPDLRIDAAGIFATLSIGRVPCATFVPWDAVKVVQAPPQVKLRAIAKVANVAIEARAEELKAEARSKLRVVSDDEAPPEGEEPANAAAWGPRLVKGGAA